MSVLLNPAPRPREMVFPACLAMIVLGTTLFYMQITFMLLLPVLAMYFIVCLIRFGLQSPCNPRSMQLLVAAGLIVLWYGLAEMGATLGDDVRWSI